MEFGQFCPIAKATEILGEKWTILIVRELLMGSTRFNELQRGLSMISPAVLSKRLTTLVGYELVIKRKLSGQKGYEYLPTKACEELLPILVDLGNWGMRWTRTHLTNQDFDADFLMLYLQRSIKPDMLPGKKSLLKFHFTDIKQQPDWWIIVNGTEIDICTIDPAQEVDVYFSSSIKCLSDIWMGETTYRKEINAGNLKLVGQTMLTKNVTKWMSNCMFSQKN
jgi:DNA-binding HxlR family transcriptional regulator